MIRGFLLQCKFLLVAWLNVTYNIVPNPLRNLYLKLFGIRIAKGSCIHRCCRFFHIGKLTIGRNSVVNFGCYLDNRRGITIGDNVGLAHNVKVYTLGHNIDSPLFETKGKPVVIEDGVFIFSNAMIMPGVTLHKNCVVLPGSVVTKDVEAYGIVGGNPAKLLRMRDVNTPPASIVTGSHYEKKGNKMNIMFVLKSFEMGGLEVVTSVLANKFVDEGNNVSIFAFGKAKHSIESHLDKRVHTYTLSRLKCNKENVYAMHAVMVEEKTQVVVNQWGLPLTPIKTINKAARGLGIKIISVYHNMPNQNGRVQTVDIKLSKTNNVLKRALLRMERLAFAKITGRAMKYNYDHSDKYMVLSPSFVNMFAEYAGIKDRSKIIVQTNPVTIKADGYVYDSKAKEKEIIYVGRIDYQQKRVERVIKTWAKLYTKYPDWHLTIVGDGEERKRLESMVKSMGLPRVSFEGFQNPISYYKHSSLLVLTSEYEGFPLVLAEAMTFGVVPVVYGSYPAVYDIIEDGKDGAIVKPVDGQFPIEKMAKAMELYMDDNELLSKTAKKSIEKSKEFSVDSIAKQWMKIMKALIK